MLDRRQQIDSIAQDFRAVHRRLINLSHSFSSELQITYTQMIILHIVKKNQGISLKEIANIMGITSSAATQQVDSLVKKGYLLREGNQADRRLVRIRLSANLDRQFVALKTRLMDQVYTIFNGLTDEELAQYAALNRKIISNILEK